jgi:chaperonin GroES
MGYLLIKPETVEAKTQSGLYLPENSTEEPDKGIVLLIGENINISGRTIVAGVEVGQRIVHKKYAGDEIKWKGQNLKLVRFEDLMAILDD